MKIALWILIGIVSVAAGTGAHYAVDTFISGPTIEEKSIVKAAVDCGVSVVEEGSLSVTSDGASGAVKKYSEGSDAVQNCFEEKFAACSPAIIKMQIPFFGVEIQYEITGSVAGGCGVAAHYTQNPAPEFIGLKASCVYDSKNPFVESESKKFFDVCTGPLIDAINEVTGTTGQVSEKSSTQKVEEQKPTIAAGPTQCGKAYFNVRVSSDGSGESSFASESKAVTDCYQSKLPTCTSATMSASLADIVIFDYRILSRVGVTDCSVEVKLAKYDEDQSFVGKTMSCQVNGRSEIQMGLQEAVDKNRCSGPLLPFFAN